ncbi:hypothetical protein CVT25_002313 [Psilocybe cyanescens]|uniref:Uncharacterized protein n=1 Tax=Psilocybe cyanescens TaxID=93625 RepID=A0A409WKP9_PSICY|nr:hypothetical protein CVT25_002313 [Psilocybe cyanescens]
MQLSFTTVFATIIAIAGVTSAAPSGEFTNSTLAPLAAPFGINYGQTQNNDVAWVDGQSKCNFVVVGPVSGSPQYQTRLLPDFLAIRTAPTRVDDPSLSTERADSHSKVVVLPFGSTRTASSMPIAVT